MSFLYTFVDISLNQYRSTKKTNVCLVLAFRISRERCNARYLHAFYMYNTSETPFVRPPAFGIVMAQVNEATTKPARSAANGDVCRVCTRAWRRGPLASVGRQPRGMWPNDSVNDDVRSRHSPWVYMRTYYDAHPPWEPAGPPYVTAHGHACKRAFKKRAATLAGSSAHTCNDTRACRIKVPCMCTQYTRQSHRLCTSDSLVNL